MMKWMIMKKAIQFLMVATLVAPLLAGGTSAMAQDGVTVTINAAAKAQPDSQFTATVDVTNVADFDAGMFDVQYDESVLQLDGVTAGRIGSTEIPVDAWNKIDAGTYRIIVNVPGVPGISGSGSLATLDFHVDGAAGGSSAIDLSNGFLNNNLSEEITATWTGDLVKVREKTDGQAPHTIALLVAVILGAVLAGLAGYFWLRRRRVQKA